MLVYWSLEIENRNFLKNRAQNFVCCSNQPDLITLPLLLRLKLVFLVAAALPLLSKAQELANVGFFRDSVCSKKISETTERSGVCLTNQTVFASAQTVCNAPYTGGTIIFCQANDCKTRCTSVAFVNEQCLIVRGAVNIPAGEAPYFRATCIAPVAPRATPSKAPVIVVALPLPSPLPSQAPRENTPPETIAGASPTPLAESGAISTAALSSATVALSTVIAAFIIFA